MLFFSITSKPDPQPDNFARDVYLSRCEFAKVAEEIARMHFPAGVEIYIPAATGFVAWLLGDYPRLFVDTANDNQIMWAPNKGYAQPWTELSDHAIHDASAGLWPLLDLARELKQDH